jgi:hypothetical protein
MTKKRFQKIFWVFIVILYLFTTSMLVHAESMGFFPDSHDNVSWHCHSEKDWNKSNNNISCCDYALSDNYSQSKIDFLTIQKITTQNYISTNETIYNIINIKSDLPKIASSPWYHYDIKYHQFSDLMWIIISLS